jgi:hypothetical protein
MRRPADIKTVRHPVELSVATRLGDGRTMRSRTPPSVLPTLLDRPRRVTRMIVTENSVMSPLASKPNVPSRPGCARVAKSCFRTEARVPSERPMASRTAPVASAA